MKSKLANTRIANIKLLPSPLDLKQEQSVSLQEYDFINHSRETIGNILQGTDNRTLLVVGPCSVHDIIGVREYARNLKKLSEKTADRFFIIMRVFFEKPRTSKGWKGILHDPHLDGTAALDDGLRLTRQILMELAQMEVPAAAEFLDPFICHYLSDLISWGCIGARTTESQVHRQLASGLPMPMGFKNGTDGCLDIAIHAMLTASYSHTYMGLSEMGQAAILHTTGNPLTHIVLRGGEKGPNFDKIAVEETLNKLKKADLPLRIMIDCSHDNSQKNHEKQVEVFKNVIEQIREGNKAIIGLQLESHLLGGSQTLDLLSAKPHYGISLTDPCLDWASTELLILDAYNRLKQ